MSTIQAGTTPKPGTTSPTEEQRLRKTARQLEAVFVQQLFKAMRETVPSDGLTNGGMGEEMFTGMLDQHFSEAAPAEWKHGPAESLVHQLSRHLSKAPASAPATTPSPDVARKS